MKESIGLLFLILLLVGCAKSGDSQESDEMSINIEEQVIIEYEGISVTAQRIDYEGLLGTELELLMQNNTEKDINVSISYMSVNNIMVETLFFVDVKAGGEALETVLLIDDFKDYGIGKISVIELGVSLSDAATWTEFYGGECIVFTSNNEDMKDQVIDSSGEIIFDENGLKIVSKGHFKSSIGTEIQLYIENRTDKFMRIDAVNLMLNDIEIDGILTCDIRPGKIAYPTVDFWKSDLEAGGIENLAELQLNFNIYQMEPFELMYMTDVISLSFEEVLE